MSSSTKNEEWVELYSKKNDKPYWYNTKSKKSVWTKPESLSKLLSNESEQWEERHSKTYQRKYWVNLVTNESAWSDPRDKTSTININDKRTKSEEEENEENSNKKIKILIQEDYPILALEREKLRKDCHNLLVTINEKYGKMLGSSKTARSCNKDGMDAGMQGIFARIMWHQLLHQIYIHGDVGSSLSRDGIFPQTTVSDEAVTKEFIDAGRSTEQTYQIMTNVLEAMKKSCSTLAELRRKAISTDFKRDIIVRVEDLGSGDQRVFYNLSYESTVFQISEQHILKLLRLYKLHTDVNSTIQDPIFLRRVFCVLSRYDSLSGSSDGYQMAFPHKGFQWLRDNVGVKIECFASPLNCWNQRIFSVARDTDQFFGSCGNFFLFDGSVGLGQLTETDIGEPLGGSFEANPPFVESIMNQMAHKIEQILTKFEKGDVPFSFSVIVPAWTDCEGIEIMTASRFLRPIKGFVLRLEKKKHTYRPGMQHRTKHLEQPSNVDTLVFFLQNEAGAGKWPVTEKMAFGLKNLLEQDSEDNRFNNRKYG